jgi:5-methyltetrahydropteroyltriglutamate--homocysteine methyltransferase
VLLGPVTWLKPQAKGRDVDPFDCSTRCYRPLFRGAAPSSACRRRPGCRSTSRCLATDLDERQRAAITRAYANPAAAGAERLMLATYFGALATISPR